jgi:hypothetical protein
MTAQLIEDMDFAEYLAHPALSASGMKRLLDMPARFKVEQEDTAAMRHGRLIHAVAFDEPHDFEVKIDGRTTAGKEQKERGVPTASADDWDVAHGIAEALRANKLAVEYLLPKNAQHEVSAFWTDPETGIELKCRFDTLAGSRIADLKSTTTARPTSFTREAAKYGYYVSAAQYNAAASALGLVAPEFYLVAVEKRAPYFISVNGINEYDLQLAELLRRKAIRTFAECAERNQWPDYTAEVAWPDAPGWWRVMAEQETGLYEIEVA